jgi:hypothetical protein
MKPKITAKTNKAHKLLDRDQEELFRDVIKGGRDRLSKPAQMYYDMLCDPGVHKPVGAPTLLGGVPGRTTVKRYQLVTSFVTNSSGDGYAVINPGQEIDAAGSSKFYGLKNNNNIGVRSTNANSGFIPNNTTLQAGETPIVLTSNYSITGVPASLQARLVACKVTVTPESNLMTQAGKMLIYQTAGHATVISGSVFSTFSVDPRCTVVTAIDADPARALQCIWKPQSLDTSVSSNNLNDFHFHSLADWSGSTVGASPVPRSGIIVMVSGQGAADVSFSLVVDLVYELRGSTVRGAKARLPDSRGMDLVFGALSLNQKAGYFGLSRHYTASMWSHVWEAGKRLAGKAISTAEQSAIAYLRASIL